MYDPYIVCCTNIWQRLGRKDEEKEILCPASVASLAVSVFVPRPPTNPLTHHSTYFRRHRNRVSIYSINTLLSYYTRLSTLKNRGWLAGCCPLVTNDAYPVGHQAPGLCELYVQDTGLRILSTIWVFCGMAHMTVRCIPLPNYDLNLTHPTPPRP